MERNEISRHELLVYRALKSRPSDWLTNREIADTLPGVALRTVRSHTLRLVQMGLIDQADVFPAHKFKWSAKGAKRNAAYAVRLEKAAEVFGL